MNTQSEQRHVLVTGGAGFIGSHLVEHLVARGDRVVILDNFSTGRRENLTGIASDRYEVIDAPVGEGIQGFEPGTFDEIYHLAAAVGVRLVIEQPIQTIETNVHETSAMLRFAARTRTPILIASTSEVYGKSSRIPFSEDDDVVFGPTIYSRWSYACSKAIDEYLALAYHREQGLPAVIARFFNTVGPRQVGEYGMVLPRFVRAALRGDSLQVYGDGQQVRSFCDVRDVVPALTALMASPLCAGRVFNLGSGRTISILELAELVVRTLESVSPIEHVPYETAFGPDFEDLRLRQPDLTRIREAVGFSPVTELPQTIRDLAQWIRRDGAVMERSA